MENIETGVDKLVGLVGEKHRIELGDAARKLGVSKAVVQEWAEFLEEEGVISIEYSLSKVFLVERKLSKKEVAEKKKEYDTKKDLFVRQVDTTIHALEHETQWFEDVKKQYAQMKQDLGAELDEVHEEMKELRHYEDLKKNIDQDIIQQKVNYQKLLDEVHQKIRAEEHKYEELVENIESEQKRISEEREDIEGLEKKESALKRRLEALQEVVGSIDSQVGKEKEVLAAEEEKLSRIQALAGKIEEEIKYKREKEIEPLLRLSEEHENKILEIQEDLIEKIKKKKSEIEGYSREAGVVSQRFYKFFQKEMEIENLLADLEKKKAEMRSELDALRKKAQAIAVMSKAGEAKKYIQELEERYAGFDQKKGAFQQSITRLKEYLSQK